jgi:hypothetical protein
MPVSGNGRRAPGMGRLERSPQSRWWWLPLVAASLLLLGPQAGRALGVAPVVEVAPVRGAVPAGDGVVPGCLGETRSLIVSSGMPYTPVRVQGLTGFFVVDLGADGSSISPTTFLGGVGPQPMEDSRNRFAGFDFFGPLAPLTLRVVDQSGIVGPLKQAGVIGTDLIREHVLTLDYAHGLLHRASRETFCNDAALRRAGFQPLSSRGSYGARARDLRCPAAPQTGACPNIPSLPVRIGGVEAIAQVDTGYDDGVRAPSLNINRAWLEQLLAAGVALERQPAADLRLTSCVPNPSETVWAYRLPAGAAVELVGTDGQAVRRLLGVTLYLKDSPAAIRSCGGIGTWPKPAGQLGASFVNDGTLVVDPFSQRLWFRGPLTPTRRP